MATFEALTFDAGTTVSNNQQTDPVYTGGLDRLDTSWQLNVLCTERQRTPPVVSTTGNSLAGLGDSVHKRSGARTSSAWTFWFDANELVNGRL